MDAGKTDEAPDILDRAIEEPDFFKYLSPREFEQFVSHVLQLLGYSVELTPATRDGGRDMILHRSDALLGDSIVLVECKHYAKSGQRVTLAQVRSFYGSSIEFRRPTSSLMVTTTGFTRDALQFAQSIPYALRLVALPDLMKWVVEARSVQQRGAESLAYRIARLPIAREFGGIALPQDLELPSTAIVLPQLALPVEYANRMHRVEQLPIDALRLISDDPRALHALSPWEFEKFIAEIVERLGFVDVLHTKRSGDGGRDVIASKRVNGIPLTFYFECKKYAEGNTVQLDTLRALLGVVAHHGSEANIGVLVTTSHFTRGCKELIASECRLDGKDYHGILDWVRDWRALVTSH